MKSIIIAAFAVLALPSAAYAADTPPAAEKKCCCCEKMQGEKDCCDKEEGHEDHQSHVPAGS